MAQVVENNSGITFDSDWICFITAKKLQRDMTSTPTASFVTLLLDNHRVIVLAQLGLRSLYLQSCLVYPLHP
jgi:hypothetical protein